MAPIRREYDKSRENDRTEAFIRGKRFGIEQKTKEVEPILKKYEELKQRIDNLPKWIK